MTYLDMAYALVTHRMYHTLRPLSYSHLKSAKQLQTWTQIGCALSGTSLKFHLSAW